MLKQKLYSTDSSGEFADDLNTSSALLKFVDHYAIQFINTDTTIDAFDFVDGDVTLAADTIDETAHGMQTGLAIQLTTTGTLPTGLSTGTTYYVIRTDADTFQLASSRANARAGTQIDITGVTSGTHTLTPTSLNMSVKLQASNDDNTWTDISGTSTSITGTGDALMNAPNVGYKYVRAAFTVTAGQLDTEVVITGKERKI